MDEPTIQEFKQTEIGLIPEDWEVVRLGEILEEVDIRVKDLKDMRKDVNPEDLTVLSLTKNYGLIPQARRFKKRIATEDVTNYKVVRKMQIVYNPYVIWEGAVHALRTMEVGIVSPVYCVWECKSNVDPSFIDRLLRTPRLLNEYLAKASGAVNRRRTVSKEDFLDIEIPLPPLEEQCKIAKVLDKIQQAIELQDGIIEQVKRLKKALMQKLFTEGLYGEEQKETEIGLIPKSWKVVRLGEVAYNFLGGGTPSTKKTEYWNGSIPWLTSAYIKEDSIFIDKGERYITEEGLKNSSTQLIPRHNLLIGTRVGVGKVAINLIDIAINQDLTGVIVRKNVVNLEFLAYALLSKKAQDQFKSKTRGTTIKGIPRADLKNLLIPLPPLEEQKQIAHILSTVDRKIEIEQRKKQLLKELFKAMLHKLMRGEIRLKEVEI